MSTKCVLVIDDEIDIREIAKMSLEMTKSWDVLTAASGTEGVAIASDHQPDAILLDLIMPEIDGLTTLRILSQTPSTQHIPVILLTATSKAVSVKEYLRLGAKAVLTKPFDPGFFGDQIATALHWSN